MTDLSEFDTGDRIDITYNAYHGGPPGEQVTRTASGTVAYAEDGYVFVDEDDTSREFELAPNSTRLVVHSDANGYRDDAIGDLVSVERGADA